MVKGGLRRTLPAGAFDVNARRLEIETDFARGRFPYPACGKADCAVHDSSMRTWGQAGGSSRCVPCATVMAGARE